MSSVRFTLEGWTLAVLIGGATVLLLALVLFGGSAAPGQNADIAPPGADGAAAPIPGAAAASPARAARGVVPRTPAPWPQDTNPQDVRPNELGRIMILEYHQFGPEAGRWTRSFDDFRRDLERLYQSGYRPIGLNEYAENRVDVPAGTTPVILTFDDSSAGQFRIVEAGSELKVDPNSALGMLTEFNRTHPEWRLRGTFFVLGGVEPEHKLFGQVAHATRKLRDLVAMGFELGNHTFWHMQLDKLEKDDVRKQLALAARVIAEAVPGYVPSSLSLPLGAHPMDDAWAMEGAYDGTAYRHRVFVGTGGDSAYGPSHRENDLFALPRIQTTDGEHDFHSNYLDYFEQHPEERYVSDGDPNLLVFPASAAKDYRPGSGEEPLPDPAPNLRAIKLR